MCRQGYEELAQFFPWLQRLLGLHTTPAWSWETAQDVCATADVCGGGVLGERVDNHNPDQSSRQPVRWEMTASGVQPLVIDEKGTE